MRAIYIVALILTAGITTSATAAKPGGEPPGPQDVNVVNTPSVTVDNVTPIPVEFQGGIFINNEPQFIGFSDDTVQGSVGILGMHNACKNKFGPGARMCLTIEVFKTTNLESIPGVRGWVAPEILAHSGGGSDQWPTCYGWTSIGAGLTLIGDSMAITPSNCANSYPVACCE